MTITTNMMQTTHRPVEDLHGLMIKSMAREIISDGRWIRKVLTGLRRKPWSGRPITKASTCHHEVFPLCKDGSEDTICDYWCDEFNVIDVCEGASYASTACLSTLLAETTIETPRWTCNRHSSSTSRSSSPCPSSNNQQSSILCCNLDKDLPPLPSALAPPDVPAQERWSNLGSFFFPELAAKNNPICALQLIQQGSMTSPISQTRASSGVFAELTAV